MATMFDLTPLAWGVAIFCAMLAGFNKSGVPGAGIFAVPLMASIFPAGPSTGIYLPMLITGDIFAVLYYHRHAEWKYVLRPLSWALVGIAAGFLFVKGAHCSDAILKRLIGAIVLVVLGGGVWLNWRGKRLQVPHTWWFAALIGMFGGFATMIANAAGPIWIIYLLAMNLNKHAFLGTNGWIFLILNVAKVPFSYGLGFITVDSLLFDLKMAPFIGLGAWLGIHTAARIPQRLFTAIIAVLTALAALKLLVF